MKSAITSENLNRALEKGIKFVTNTVHAEGLWSGSDSELDQSIEWITGFVLSTLASIPAFQVVYDQGIKFLIAQIRRTGGWGYYAWIAKDCDSTAMVLRSLIRGHWVHPAVLNIAISFILRHQSHKSGGFYTHVLNDEIRSTKKAVHQSEEETGYDPHSWITANALQALLEAGILKERREISRGADFLEKKVNREGVWESCWWNGFTYATYNATLVLSQLGRLNDQRWDQIIEYTTSEVHDDGGWADGHDNSHVFATALALLILLLSPNILNVREIIDNGINWLLVRQLDDGSWPCVRIFLIPPRNVRNLKFVTEQRIKGSDTSIDIIKNNKLLVTAIALKAIFQYGLLFQCLEFKK